MKDFHDFKEYCTKNIDSIKSSIIDQIDIDDETMLSLGEKEWKFIIQLINHSCFSLLEQYHNWLNQEHQEM